MNDISGETTNKVFFNQNNTELSITQSTYAAKVGHPDEGNNV